MKRAALALALFGCFNPDLSQVTLTCKPGDTCPDGYECNNAGVCAAIGSASDGGGTSSDLSGNGQPTPKPSEACPLQSGGAQGLGFDVTNPGKPTVIACPAKFKAQAGSTANDQCRAPYTVCTKADNIDLKACAALGEATSAFFVANVPEHRQTSMQLMCGPATGMQSRFWAGCGKKADQLVCSGFSQSLECFSVPTFQCFGDTLGAAVNTDGASGVLCCKP